MASNPKELEHARHWLLTVKKYLEHVFTKLGVENRHAAALRALEAAGLLGRPLSAESRQPFSARLAAVSRHPPASDCNEGQNWHFLHARPPSNPDTSQAVRLTR